MEIKNNYRYSDTGYYQKEVLKPDLIFKNYSFLLNYNKIKCIYPCAYKVINLIYNIFNNFQFLFHIFKMFMTYLCVFRMKKPIVEHQCCYLIQYLLYIYLIHKTIDNST